MYCSAPEVEPYHMIGTTCSHTETGVNFGEQTVILLLP